LAGSPAKFKSVVVYYATDRDRVELGWRWYLRRLAWALGALAAAILLPVLVKWIAKAHLAKWALPALRVALWLTVVVLTGWAFEASYQTWLYVRTFGMWYGGNLAEPPAAAPEYELGTCVVDVPLARKEGEIPKPNALKGEFLADPVKHFRLSAVERKEEDAFFLELRGALGSGEPTQTEAFVYIHGFNNTFEDAAFRTAQIAHDLDFRGAPIFFSWPSRGEETAYTVDWNTTDLAIPHLAAFLRSLKERSGASVIHLIAHSLGSRVLGYALKEIPAPSSGEPIFHTIVFGAPDIDARTFRTIIAPAVRTHGKIVTLYASSRDLALTTSKVIHGHTCAGDTDGGPLVIPGIETIDVSAVSGGHSYIGSNGRVLDDLRVLLDGRLPAKEREKIRKLGLEFVQAVGYWILRKPS
jgi:esterase/lipase superfamily enzyme